MTDVQTVYSLVGGTLRELGFAGRGSTWRLKGEDVQWVVYVDQLPHGNRLAIDIGLDLQVEAIRRRPTDCPILLHLENLPPTGDLAISMALDLDSDLSSEARDEILLKASHALGVYARERSTLVAVRRAFRAREFESGFVRRDARAVLQTSMPA